MLTLSSICLVLFVVLVVHIAMVTNPKNKPHYGIQLSRIDFTQAIDSNEANKIAAVIKQIDGVGNTMINYEHNNIVFAHQNEMVSGEEVYQKLIATTHVSAKKFSLTPEEIAKTAKCPVINNKSFLMSIAHKIQKTFL